MLFADLSDLVHLCGSSVKMCNHNKLDIGIELECLFKGSGIHVPGVFFGVYKYGFSVFVCHGVYRSIKGKVGTENFAARKCSLAWSCLAVELFSGKLYCHVKSGRTAGKTDSVFAADILCHLLFCFVDVFADCRYPVGHYGVIHPLFLFTVHSGACEPQF